MPRESDFLIGLQAGQNFMTGIQDRQENKRRYELEQAQQERYHSDSMSLHKKQLEMEGERSSAYRKMMEQQLELTAKKAQLEASRQERRTKQFGKLLELENKTYDLDPLSDTYAKDMVNVWKGHLDLFDSEDPEVRSQAEAIRAKATKTMVDSAGFKRLQQITEAEDLGYIPKGDRSPAAVSTGLLGRDNEEMRTYANSLGVDLNTPQFDDAMVGLQSSPRGGLMPSAKAKMRSMIESQAIKNQRASAPNKGKLSVGTKMDPITGKSAPVYEYEAQGDVAEDSIAAALLKKQGLGDILQDKSDEAGKPRVRQNGVVYRWSQKAGNYVAVE